MSEGHDPQIEDALFDLAPKNWRLRTRGVEYDEDRTQLEVDVFNPRYQKLASFKLRKMPGCCGVLIAYYVRATTNKPSKATITLNKVINLIKQAARRVKYGAVLFAQTPDNFNHQVLFARADVVRGVTVINGKTGNPIALFTLDLGHKPPKNKPLNFGDDQ